MRNNLHCDGRNLALQEEEAPLTGLFAAPPILFAAGFIGLVGSILLARNSAYGARAPAKSVPKVWLAAAVIQAVACFGHAMRGELPPVLVYAGVNSLQLLAVSLLWVGAARMAGRAIPHWAALLTPLVWLLACALPGFTEAMPLRLSLYLPLAYGLAAWAVLDLLGIYRRHGVRAALDMAVLVGIVTLTLATTVVARILFPPDTQDPMMLFTGLPGLLTALYGTTLPFLMLAVSREWGALEEGANRNALLQKGRSEVERLHAGLPALIFVREFGADGSTRLLYRGGNVEAVTGCPAASLAHLDNLGLLAKDRAPLQRAVLVAQREGSASVDWPMTRPDGDGVTWLRTSWRLQERRPDGSMTMVGYSINISAEREANARAAAAGRLASLGEMATGLAHELTQPLQAIMTGAEIAQVAARRMQADAIDARLEKVLQQVIRARGIISNLRRFAGGEPEAAPPRPIRLAASIGNVMVLIGGLLREAGIEVVTELDPEAQAVLGHPVALEQVLTNLLLNARDALSARPPGAPLRINLSARVVDGLVCFQVADTGGGIRPDLTARLFEPFVTTKGPDKGTGLGLSISHGLITSMGGSIDVTNGPEGAIFTITLPLATLPAEAAP